MTNGIKFDVYSYIDTLEGNILGIEPDIGDELETPLPEIKELNDYREQKRKEKDENISARGEL